MHPLVQFIYHVTADAKCREARQLKNMLPSTFIVDSAVKMLHALSAPFIPSPTSTSSSVAKGTWHGVEIEVNLYIRAMGLDDSAGMLPFVKTRAAECLQVFIEFLRTGPDSEAAALLRSAGPRVRQLVLRLCADFGDVLLASTFGLDHDECSESNCDVSGACASSRPAAVGASAQPARACMGCGVADSVQGKARLKLCGGCEEVYFCSVSCQRLMWGRHKVQCRALSAARRGGPPAPAGATKQ